MPVYITIINFHPKSPAFRTILVILFIMCCMKSIFWFLHVCVLVIAILSVCLSDTREDQSKMV